MVLGGHGDTWCRCSATAPSTASRSRQLIAEDKLDAIVERTRNGGGEIVKLMGTSAYYAPASARSRWRGVPQRPEAPAAVRGATSSGEYGYKDLYIGVPVVHRRRRRREDRRASS